MVDKKYKIIKLNFTRKLLIFWTLFIGLGALLGSISMFVDLSGKTFGYCELLPLMKKLPLSEKLFDNMLFPGIMLLLVNCVTNLTAFVFLLLKKKIGFVLATIFGFTLVLWIIIQFIIFPANFLSILYFIFGILQFSTGIWSLINYKENEFNFDNKIYTNLNRNSKTLVVYFSRQGYTKKIAYELANCEFANIVEIKTNERTDDILGFWWCGRYSMHGWKMPISNEEIDLDNYNKVIIISPVWVFGISSPILDFLDKYKLKLKSKKVIFYFNHFNRSLPSRVKSQLKQYECAEIHSVTTKWGKSKFLY